MNATVESTGLRAGIGRLGFKTSALRAYTMVLALVVLWIIFYYFTDGTFLSFRNLSNLMRQTAVTGILAVGMLMVIVCGQIDLSVGSVVGLAGGVAAIMQGPLHYGLAESLLAGIAVGLGLGKGAQRLVGDLGLRAVGGLVLAGGAWVLVAH